MCYTIESQHHGLNLSCANRAAVAQGKDKNGSYTFPPNLYLCEAICQSIHIHFSVFNTLHTSKNLTKQKFSETYNIH